MEAFELRGLAGDDDVRVALFCVGAEVGADEVEVLVEAGLRLDVVRTNRAFREAGASVELDDSEGGQQAVEVGRGDEELFGRGEFDLA